MISTPVALLVLLSAAMHAGWNFVVKASQDRFLDYTGLAVAGAAIAACVLPWLPLPAAAAWPWLATTTIIHVGYYLLLMQAYRHADLSIAYPLMRGSAPVLIALAAPLAGDSLNLGLLIGIALVAAGIALPVGMGLYHGGVSRSGLGYGFATAAVIALYTIIDGIGARQSGHALAYTLWLFFLNAWLILAVALCQRGRQALVHLRRRWLFSLAGSVLTIGSYALVLWAMTVASIPAVAALRETSVIFAAILGAWLLKERMGRWRIAGAVLVALGAIAIRLS
ncbi:MAG: EamA family transporter [Azovibrio sp.]|nr:EamA family transporter [Azovibrio sp.]